LYVRRRALIRLAFITSGVVALAGLGLMFALYSLNHHQVLLAHEMMDDAARLQIGESSLGDVLVYAHKYHAEVSGSWHEDRCTQTDCLVSAGVHQNDFGERHPKLGSLATHISRRYWDFATLMWVKDGKLDAIEQWFWFTTPNAKAAVITDTSQPSSKLCRNPFFRLHHTFVAYEAPKHFSVWVDSSAISDKEILRLNINCAGSIRGCRDAADMAPIAWTKYESDRSAITSDSWLKAAQDGNCR
jgi:hypothetical protein